MAYQIPEEILIGKYAQKERAMAPVRNLLNRGIKHGVLKKMDTDRVMEIYFASLLGIINMFVAESQDENIDTLYMLREHAEIYGNGLLA